MSMRCRILCRCLVFFAAGAAHAQRAAVIAADSAARLPTVEVHASIVPTAGPNIGSGVPARTTTVTGPAITAWQPRILPDVLSQQASVSFYDDLGSPWKLNLSSRGFTVGPTVGLPPGITVFLDGVRQNEPDAQEVNFDLLPTNHVERVELLSGTASLLGPNSLGGAINLITAHGHGPMSGALEATTGSFGAYNGSGHASGSSGPWDYYLSGGVGSENGWRQATSDHNYNFSLNVGHSAGERGVRLEAYSARSRAATAGSLPESIFDTSPQVNFTPGDFEDLDAQQLSLSAYTPAAKGRASLTGYARRSAAERFNVNQAPDPNVRGATKDYVLGATADWRWSGQRGPGTLSIRVGGDGTANQVRVRIFNELQSAEPDLTTDVKSPSEDVAGYALADYTLGRFTLSTGARHDYVRVPFHDLLDRTDDTTSSYTHFSPRAGLSAKVGDGALLYTSIGGSFRAPAILELGCADPDAACPLPFALGDDPPLEPVTARTYEAGARWAYGPFLINGSLYRTDVRNEIFFIASEHALLSGYFTNLDRTRRDGGELSIEGSALRERFDWYGNYAYTRATFQSPVQIFSTRSDDDFTDSPLAGSNTVQPGDRLPLVPAHQVKAGGSLQLTRTVGIGLDVRYIGQQWLRGDEANETRPLDAYSLANGRVGFALRGWEITGVVTNLFDTRRAVFGTFNENRQSGMLERFLTPMTTRTFALTLRRSFGRVP
jgi:outer membrane receptor protein involved in Fe transport